MVLPGVDEAPGAAAGGVVSAGGVEGTVAAGGVAGTGVTCSAGAATGLVIRRVLHLTLNSILSTHPSRSGALCNPTCHPLRRRCSPIQDCG